MNLFYLDVSPTVAAQMHCDKHVVKMIIETAQLLSTAHHVLGSTVEGRIYKPTHINHPSNVWVRQNSVNYRWASTLALSLCMEYKYRYNRRHATEEVIANLLDAPDDMPIGPMTAIPQCMPDQYKDSDPVKAYRKYYKGDKARFARWTKREVPYWWNE